MIIRYCLFLLAIAGIFTEARAQQQPLLDPANAIAFNEFFRLLVPPEDVEERANLFTDWQQGAVFLSQGRFASDITFNYDVLNNTLLVQVDEKKYSLNPIAVDSILVANRAQVLINPIILEGIGSDLLLLRLYNGLHLSLFRNNLAAVIDSDNRTSSIAEIKYTGDSDVRIALEQKYLLLNKDTNELREVLGKKKELKKWENGDQILTFIKNQNLDFSNEDDLIQVVQYYEQLNYGDID